MSVYEWEDGIIKIPTKEWSAFRTALIKEYNRKQRERYEMLKRSHAKLKEAIKGKRGKNRAEALGRAADRICQASLVPDDLRWDLVSGYGANAQLKPLPKKKDMKILPVSKSAVLELPDATIALDNKKRTVRWSVPENNHASDYARKDPVAQLMFRLLAKVRWTRGSGGQIIGNDEINRDSYNAGGGSNYVVKEYGPKSRRARR